MGTVNKALNLLEHFTLARPEIGLSELARLSGMNKATVYRLISSLEAGGLVEQSHERRYRVGPAVLRLAALREATVPLRQGAMPILQRLSDTTGETAHLSLIQGDKLGTYAFTYADAHGTSVRMEDAAILPFHATASGLSVLAHLSPARREAILAVPLPRLTPRTETDPDALRALLDRIAETGAAESTGGFEADVHSRALPLFSPEGAVTGALAVATPTSRLDAALEARIKDALDHAARAIMDLWGGAPPSPTIAEGQSAPASEPVS